MCIYTTSFIAQSGTGVKVKEHSTGMHMWWHTYKYKLNSTLKTLGKISDDKTACLTEETQK